MHAYPCLRAPARLSSTFVGRGCIASQLPLLARGTSSRKMASATVNGEQTPPAQDLRNKRSESFKAHSPKHTLRYVDVGVNLTDPTFRGCYRDKQVHQDDLDDVIARAFSVGVQKFMVTGSSLEESKRAVDMAVKRPGVCYATVGVHPCTANEFDKSPAGPDKMLQDIEKLAQDAKESGHAVAFGEIGLDYDRLHYTGKDQQLRYFKKQLEVAVRVQLPLFLHMRAASEDFERLLQQKLPQLPKLGLVHSFTGTVEEMRRLLDMGLSIGVNGCSLKTEENLAVVKEIPLDRLQIETDGPWCEIRSTHASAKLLEDGPELPKAVKKERYEKGAMVKGRNEPVTLPRVAHVIAKVKDMPVEKICEAAWFNSIRMFGLGENL